MKHWELASFRLRSSLLGSAVDEFGESWRLGDSLFSSPYQKCFLSKCLRYCNTTLRFDFFVFTFNVWGFLIFLAEPWWIWAWVLLWQNGWWGQQWCLLWGLMSRYSQQEFSSSKHLDTMLLQNTMCVQFGDDVWPLETKSNNKLALVATLSRQSDSLTIIWVLVTCTWEHIWWSICLLCQLLADWPAES